MTNDSDEATAPTRRAYLAYGGAAVFGGLLAGCADLAGNDPAQGTTTGRPETRQSETTPSETEPTETEPTETEPPTTTATQSYAAELSPVGEVTLDEPPTNVFTHFPWFPDMASALGRGDTINYLWWDGTVAGLEYFTAGFDGFEIEWADAAGEYGFGKEQLYDLDSDLHLVDPAWVTTQNNWSRADVDEIADNVGPWFGNYYSNYHATPPEEWADGYEYYSLWELFDRVATLYGERARYEVLQSVHDDLLATVEANLPPASERPTAAYLSISEDLSSIYLLRLNAPGYWNSHTRPLGAVDAFADEQISGAFKQVDMEALLEADPDALLALWTVTDTFDFEALTQNLEDDTAGGELSAVQNGRVYPQGTRWQGPLTNLFQLEMTAKQLYPDQFGAWPEDGSEGSYPEFGASEQLFDHQRVADVVDGDV